jgi:NADPH:quinone reductase-like Zn-dependent oxidoreductase
MMQFPNVTLPLKSCNRHRISTRFLRTAASVPVIAVTAWQMLHDHAHVVAGERTLILGAAGNVGSYAVQLARLTGAYVIAVIHSDDAARLKKIGANEVIDTRVESLSGRAGVVDVVIDAEGGEMQRQSLAVLKPGGILISSASAPQPALLQQHDVQGSFFLVNTTTGYLNSITNLLNSGELEVRVGTVLPLDSAREAHEMLDGTRPYARGKIVLTV